MKIKSNKCISLLCVIVAGICIFKVYGNSCPNQQSDSSTSIVACMDCATSTPITGGCSYDEYDAQVTCTCGTGTYCNFLSVPGGVVTTNVQDTHWYGGICSGGSCDGAYMMPPVTKTMNATTTGPCYGG
jgi:hypothetical protein